jgi:hypothetical protein
MTEKQLAIIRKIQQIQLDIENGMADSLPKVFKTLSNEVIDLASELSLDPKDRAKTLREMVKLKKDIADTIVNNAAYQTEVVAVINGYKALAEASNEYLSLILDDFSPKTELYKAILETNIEVTKDALIGSGIRNNFSNAIQEVLKSNIAGVSNRAELNKTLRQFIEGTEKDLPFLQRYVKQTTNDSVMAFNAEYIQTVSEDLGVEYYFYAGTIIEDTRPFCSARTGRFFTTDQVRKWGDPKLDWVGRMSGTNANTIFIYRGGYNCRHQLWPVSQEQYESAKEAGRTGVK